ncbi:hypothetical protein WJX72_000822 [[Myrmecia] bisecta]|uniref:Uncharacterized protein n=1 Tax=[Myrmecia] bisecta TaxID=41462 RepID=A0AAW1Q6H0_9CHLO
MDIFEIGRAYQGSIFVADLSLKQCSLAVHLTEYYEVKGVPPSVVMAITPKTATCSSVADRLSDADRASWYAVRERVQSLGFDAEEAEKMMVKAFGWGSQVYWRKSKVEEVPQLDKVQATLDYIKALGVPDDAKLAKVVKSFPEVLGCGVEDQLKQSVAVLEKQWKMKGPVIANAVQRQPKILGYNFDCEGDCAGECNRCWVRF